MAEDFLHPLEAAQRQRSLILKLTRVTFVILIVTVVLVTIINEASAPGSVTAAVGLEVAWYVPLVIAAVLASLALIVDLLTPNKKIATLGGVFLGLLAGLIGAVAMSYIVDLVLVVTLPPQALTAFASTIGLIKLMLGICICYLAIITVLQTQDDFRLVIPYVEFSKQIRGVKPFLLDTSALIDSRIVDLAASGLIQSPIVIPKFVIAELQQLADAHDRLKRGRGRRGLDAVGKLQRLGRVEVTIEETAMPPVGGVDEALVDLANQLSARIMTTDLGLTRVAQIHGVIVLNLHEIAASLRPTLVQGEQITLTLARTGEQPGQAVGYLEDGTMVVVENAAHRVGAETGAVVQTTMQTAAGRLVFARLINEPPGAAPPPPAPPADRDDRNDRATSADERHIGESAQPPVAEHHEESEHEHGAAQKPPARKSPFTATGRNPRR